MKLPLENTIAICESRADYDRLMERCEKAGQVWGGGELPTAVDNFGKCGSSLLVNVSVRVIYWGDEGVYRTIPFANHRIVTVTELLGKPPLKLPAEGKCVEVKSLEEYRAVERLANAAGIRSIKVPQSNQYPVYVKLDGGPSEDRWLHWNYRPSPQHGIDYTVVPLADVLGTPGLLDAPEPEKAADVPPVEPPSTPAATKPLRFLVQVCDKPPKEKSIGQRWYWYSEADALCSQVGEVVALDGDGFKVRFAKDKSTAHCLDDSGCRRFHKSWLTTIPRIILPRDKTAIGPLTEEGWAALWGKIVADGHMSEAEQWRGDDVNCVRVGRSLCHLGPFGIDRLKFYQDHGCEILPIESVLGIDWLEEHRERKRKEIPAKSDACPAEQSQGERADKDSGKHAASKPPPKPEPKFKTAQLVKICATPPEDRDKGPAWVEGMDKTCGMVGVVINSRFHYGQTTYAVAIEGSDVWTWTYLEEWLEPEKAAEKFSVGDAVKIVDKAPKDMLDGWMEGEKKILGNWGAAKHLGKTGKVCGLSKNEPSVCVLLANATSIWCRPEWLIKLPPTAPKSEEPVIVSYPQVNFELVRRVAGVTYGGSDVLAPAVGGLTFCVGDQIQNFSEYRKENPMWKTSLWAFRGVRWSVKTALTLAVIYVVGFLASFGVQQWGVVKTAASWPKPVAEDVSDRAVSAWDDTTEAAGNVDWVPVGLIGGSLLTALLSVSLLVRLNRRAKLDRVALIADINAANEVALAKMMEAIKSAK